LLTHACVWQLSALSGKSTSTVDIFVPMVYNVSHDFFQTGDPDAFTFHLESTIDQIDPVLLQSLASFKNVKLTADVVNSTVSAGISGSLALDLSSHEEEHMVEVMANVNIEDFDLTDPKSPVHATFSGYLSNTFEQDVAPWIKLKAGGVSGTLTLTDADIVAEEFTAYVYPTITDFPLEADVPTTLTYKRPNFWQIESTLISKMNLKDTLTAVVQLSSPPSLTPAALDAYVFDPTDFDPSGQTELTFKIASSGEVFRVELETNSRLAPESLLGPRGDAKLKMYVASTGTSDVNHTATFGLFTSLEEIKFSDSFFFKNVRFEATANLITSVGLPPSSLSFSLGTDVYIPSPSSPSNTTLLAGAVVSGLQDNRANRTELAATFSVAQAWAVNSQLSFASATLAFDGSFQMLPGRSFTFSMENVDWKLSPLQVTAAGEVSVFSNSASTVAVDARGIVDLDFGDWTTVASGRLASSTSVTPPPLLSLVPASHSSEVPIASTVDLLNGDFEMCVSTKPLVYRGVECIDGVTVSGKITTHPDAQGLFMDNFGTMVKNHTIGMTVTAQFQNTSSFVRLQSDLGLPLASAVWLKSCSLTSTNLNSADSSATYSYELLVDLGDCGSRLNLKGEGQWGADGATSTRLSLKTTRSTGMLNGAVEISEGCEAECEVEYLTGARTGALPPHWKATGCSWANCSAVLGSGDDYVHLNGTVDVLGSTYVMDIEAGTSFENLGAALALFLNVTEVQAAVIIPSNLANIAITSRASIVVRSATDTLSLKFETEVASATELADAVANLPSVTTASRTMVTCEIELSLSKPTWADASVKFLVVPENGYIIGPVTVDVFELRVDTTTAGGSLVVQASAVFTLLDQQFRLDGGVTTMASDARTANLGAALIYDASNPLKYDLGFGRGAEGAIGVKSASIRVTADSDPLVRASTTSYTWTITDVTLSAAVAVQFPQYSSEHAATLVINQNTIFANYAIEIAAINAVDLKELLGDDYPMDDFLVTARGEVNFKYDTYEKRVEVAFTSKLYHGTVGSHLATLMPELGVESSWGILMTAHMSSDGGFGDEYTWFFRGFVGVDNVAIGERFVINSGLMKVECSSSGFVYGLNLTDVTMTTNTAEAGKNTTISARLEGTYSTQTKLLSLSGRSTSHFRPYGVPSVTITDAVLTVKVDAAVKSLKSVEGSAQALSLFTEGFVYGSFVVKNNGRDVYLRIGGASIPRVDLLFWDLDLSSYARSITEPLSETALTSANLTFSNFNDENRGIETGFSVEADGYIGDSNTQLQQQLEDVKDGIWQANFKFGFKVLESASIPDLYMLFEYDGCGIFSCDNELWESVNVVSFGFNLRGLVVADESEFLISYNSMLRIDLSSLGFDEPLFTTIDGEFSGTAPIESGPPLVTDWRMVSTTKLASSVEWTPNGLSLFSLTNPTVAMHFSGSPTKMDTLELASENATLTEWIELKNPRIHVQSFAPDDAMLIYYINTHMTMHTDTSNPFKNSSNPLRLVTNGGYTEEQVVGGTSGTGVGKFYLDGDLSHDWWVFGNDLLVVKAGSHTYVDANTLDGKLDSLAFQYTWASGLKLDGEAKTSVKFSASTSDNFGRFCFMFEDIPITTLTKMIQKSIYGNDDGVADNLMLREFEGVSPLGGQLKFGMGTYTQDCVTTDADFVEGRIIKFGVTAIEGAELLDLWKLVFGSSKNWLDLECELEIPAVRSEKHPLRMVTSAETGSQSVVDDGVTVTLEMADNESNELTKIGVEFVMNMELGQNVAVGTGAASNLKFALSGTAVYNKLSDGSEFYDVVLQGRSMNSWKQPFGLEWLEIAGGQATVNTRSDRLWDAATYRIELDANVAFNSSYTLEIYCEVWDGGRDVVMTANMLGKKELLSAAIGVIAGGDLGGLSMYLDDIVTLEEISFGLSTEANRWYHYPTDMVLGSGVKKGVQLSVELVNMGGQEGGVVEKLIGPFGGSAGHVEAEIWVGIFDVAAGETEGLRGFAYPPVSFSVKSRNADLSYGGGSGAAYLEIKDWMGSAEFSTIFADDCLVSVQASVVWRPEGSGEDGIVVLLSGEPGLLRGEMDGEWDGAFGKDWLKITGGEVEFEWENGADGWGLKNAIVGGAGVISFGEGESENYVGGKVSVKIGGEDGMDNFYVHVLMFGVLEGKGGGLYRLVDNLMGRNVLVKEGEGRLLSGANSTSAPTSAPTATPTHCGSSDVAVPSVQLYEDSEGEDVKFLQQLLVDAGYLESGKWAAWGFGKMDETTTKAVNDLGLFFDVDETAVVTAEVWESLCLKSEENSGVDIGGEWEWLNEFRLGNVVWEMKYANSEYWGEAEGVEVSAMLNVRKGGVVADVMAMLSYADLDAEAGGWDPELGGGVFVGGGGEVRAWVQAGGWYLFEDVVRVDALRLEGSVGGDGDGNWGRLEISADTTIQFEACDDVQVDLSAVVGGREGGLVLTGVIKGEWRNPFGLGNGVVLRQAGVTVGVGAGDVYVGVGAQFSIGTCLVNLVGRAGMAGGFVSKDLILSGSLVGIPGGDWSGGEVYFGKAIGVRDVMDWWAGEAFGGWGKAREWGLGGMDIPDEWGLYDTYFRFSSSELELFGTVFAPGMVVSTGISLFGLDCSATFAVVWVETTGGERVLDIQMDVTEGLEQAEEVARRKLLQDILPDELIDPGLMSNDARKIKEKDEGFSFDLEMFEMESVELKSLNFLHLAMGGRPILVLKFKFFGVSQTLEIETLTLKEVWESSLWDVLDELGFFLDSLFSLPDCVWNDQCYNMGGGGDEGISGYCRDLCVPGSLAWQGKCPKEDGMCFADDEDCFKCFGTCDYFHCRYE